MNFAFQSAFILLVMHYDSALYSASYNILILADHAEPCSATVPSQHWAAEKQT